METKKWKAGDGLWKDEIIAAGLLMAFAFLINRGIEIKGLYMDDLYLWSCYGEQSIREFVLPLGSTRFRFIYYLAAWLELAFVGSHIAWFVPLNIILNGAIAYTIYRFGKSLSKSWWVGMWCGFLYLLSRMSYYQVGQVYGLMESLALWAALGILYCLFQYKNRKGDGEKYALWAAALYFCICFIHERYLALLPLFFLVFLLKKEKKASLWGTVAAVFAVVMGIRYLTIGTISPAGTGGTNVADTFHLSDALSYAVSQVLYIFGINAGPDHLNGMSWGNSPLWIHLLVLFADMVLLVLVVLFVKRVVSDKEKRRQYLSDLALFLVFIALCIGSSSVTIRVETRWVYVSAAAAYLLAAYFFGVITAKKGADGAAGKRAWHMVLACAVLFASYGLLMFPVETFYRSQYPNLYLWPNQLRYNSLAEVTYEKYGDGIFGKKIYILGNTYEMSDFTARTFFKTFDRERKAEGTTVTFIDSIQDIGAVTGDMLILKEDPAHNAFEDITGVVRNLKLERLYGCYEDGWIDQSAKLRIMTGSTGIIELECYYPGVLTGKEVSKIYVNGEFYQELSISQELLNTSVKAAPYQIVELSFENNFIYGDAMEQRGEKPFSMIVNMTVQ